MKIKFLRLFLFIGILLFIFVKAFVFDYILISGESMEETYHDGEVVLIEKQCENFNRFDVVVVNVKPMGVRTKFIKRIIGLPNERVQIVNGYVYINGSKIENDVSDTKMEYAGIAAEEIILADNEYFILGDNRNASEDSRYERIGVVKEEDIFGRVIKKLFNK